MTTANDIISDALEEIGYKAAEIPIEPADSQLALRKLNDMLAEWGEGGTLPGAAPVANTSTNIRASRGVIAAIKMNLAGRLTSPFRRPLTAELSASIKVSSDALTKIVTKIGKVKLPSNLPTGSGNHCSYRESRFFAQSDTVNF